MYNYFKDKVVKFELVVYEFYFCLLIYIIKLYIIEFWGLIVF